MSGFVKRLRTVDTVNPAGGIDPAKAPNVGQYGWTSFDAGNVNQIIEYVEMCKNYAEEAGRSAEYIEGKVVELEAFMRYIEKVYEDIKPIYDNILPIYHDIEVRHEDIKVRHEDIITKHSEVEDWHYEVNIMTEETEANAAKALTSQLLAGQSEQGAEGWYDKSYELYEDLRKGNIYRGTWNPHTGAYPDNGGTNSTWDVILNEGETEFRWNNILWFWGDRLVYLKEENKYQQIESGTTVTSINGKKGAVVLDAEDVKAVPITRTVNGKALSANISITSTDTNSVPTTRRVNNKVLDSDIVLIHSDVQAVPLDRKINNKLLNADITLNPSDVGALPSTGGTLTGPLIVKDVSTQALTLDSTNAAGCRVIGRKDGVDDWYVGRGNSVGDVVFYSYKHVTSLIMKSDSINFNRDLYLNNHKVYHQGFKPTASDVRAIPVNTIDGTPVAAYYRVETPSTTGTKIKLPFKMSHNKMVSFTVRVYQNYHTADIQFSGYLLATNNQWHQPKAIMIAGSKAVSVAMGREDDGTAYVWVEGADYRGVAVFDVVAGFKGGDWNSGWVITSDNNKPNIILEATTHPPYSPNNKPTTADVTGLEEALKNSGGNPVLSTAWVQLRTAMWNGYVAADGQLLKRADYPDAWAAVKNRKVPVIAEADWTKEPQYRGFFTEGDGSSTFRIPDYNGKYAGSLGATFLRGDGLNAGKYNGSIQGDAIRNIKGKFGVNGGPSSYSLDFAANSTDSGPFLPADQQTSRVIPTDAFSRWDGSYNRGAMWFDASLQVPTSADNHPVNVTGCWAIKLFGSVQNAGEIDAATLATQLAEAQSKIALSEVKIAALESRRITQVVDVLWEGFATVADVLLHLSQPLVAGDMLTIEHNDNAKLTTAVVSLVPNKMVAEQTLYFPFAGNATTSLKYVNENTLKTSIFTTGYAISKVYRTRYALV